MPLTQVPTNRNKRRRRGTYALASAALVAVGATVVLAFPAMAAESRKIDWDACSASGLDCGMLQVPIDWSKPKGDQIKIRVVRRPAAGSAKLGTLIINPGGPGVSGTDVTQIDRFGGEIAKRFDVVGFDTRGIDGSSATVRCSGDLVDTIRVLENAPITNQEQFEDRKRISKSLEDSCRQMTTPSSLVDHVDTLSVVKDLDAIRAALGESKLNFYGMSYGTLIAQQYAQTYPKNVRAIVSDSNMDHSVDMAGWFSTHASTVQGVIDQLAKSCSSDSKCALYKKDVPAFFAQLLEHANKGELWSSDGISTPVALIGRVDSAVEKGATWRELAEQLVKFDKGASAPATRPAFPTSANPVIGKGGSTTFVDQATMCQDWDLGVQDFAQWSALHTAASAKNPSVPSVPKADRFASYCLGWTGPVSNPPKKIVAKNTNKILMINSKYDTATGYAWATSAAKQFGDAAFLLTYEGSGHVVRGRSSCIDAAVDAYLTDLTMPEKGKSCPAA